MTGRLGNMKARSGIDWTAVVIFFALMMLGWLNIYAAVFDEETTSGFVLNSRYGSQLFWIGICAVTAAVIMMIDEIYYHIIAYPSYIFMLLVLVATLFIGTRVNGAQSWIRLGGMSVQPAEFAKITTSLALARYMSSYSFSMSSWRSKIYAMLLFAAPMVVIVMQNDTGSAIVFSAFMLVLFREGFNSWAYVAIGMLIFLFIFSFVLTPAVLLWAVIIICTVMSGVLSGRWFANLRYIAALALVSLVLFFGLNLIWTGEVSYYVCLLISSLTSMILVGIYAWRNKLKSIFVCIAMFVGSVILTEAVDIVFDHMQIHQQKRILNLLGVETDLQYWGYNVNQSKIAIGSGGFLGKGYLHGTQTKYDFVPEQSTDFIFCTVGEEWGFWGSTAVLVLFCWLILRLIKMGERQHEAFGRVYCYSVAAIIMFHVLVNVGMTIGIMPVIGIPLPLFSYGGSSLLAFTILFFIAVKLDSRRSEGGDHLPVL